TPTFDWSDVMGAENYNLLVDSDSDFSSPEIQVTVTVSTYTPTVGLSDGKYWWKVRVRDAAGNVSDWSSTWTLTTKTVVRGVEVSISPESKSGLPGETLTYGVTVKNTGSIDDTYTLSAVGTEDWSVSVEPTQLTLAAGATGNATLSVMVPPDASENDSMTVTVSVISEAYPSVTDSDTCRTVVKGVPVAPGIGVAVPLAILVLLILLAILLLAYLSHRRRKAAARRRVLRDASPGFRRWVGDRDC
ncbi:MAG: FixG Ig-like domain-containing protein, partial [Candidatus Bathyarchaeia archaeon]